MIICRLSLVQVSLAYESCQSKHFKIRLGWTIAVEITIFLDLVKTASDRRALIGLGAIWTAGCKSDLKDHTD